MKPLKKVRMRNFRCFEEFELELHPQLTVLVAENGGGKTVVLDAIAIGLSPIIQRLSSANQRLSSVGFKDTDFRVIPIGEGRNGEPKFGAADYAQVVMETIDGPRWDKWKPSAQGVKGPPDKIGLSELHKYLDDVITPSTEEKPRQSFPFFAYYGTQRAFLKIPDRLRSGNVAYSHPASALVGALDAESNFKECLQWFDAAEADELRLNKGRSSGDYIESDELANVRHVIGEVLGGTISGPRFDARSHKFIVTSKLPDGTEVHLRVDQLSQGYQAMLALAMDFARRMSLANPGFVDGSDVFSVALGYLPEHAPAIMLVDEIDLHLHPAWQQRVLGDLMRTFPHTQFIVTTHSPQVLSTVRKENIRVLKCVNGNWPSREPHRNPYAHTNALSLEAIMEGNAYPPLPLTDDLREYQRLVGDDRHETPRALELRAKLENEWGENDIELQLMDITIRKNETMRKLRQKNG